MQLECWGTKRQRPPAGGRKDGHALEKRIRECMTKALIFSGITTALGFVGVCENGGLYHTTVRGRHRIRNRSGAGRMGDKEGEVK